MLNVSLRFTGTPQARARASWMKPTEDVTLETVEVTFPDRRLCVAVPPMFAVEPLTVEARSVQLVGAARAIGQAVTDAIVAELRRMGHGV